MDAQLNAERSYGNQPFLFSIALALITIMIWGSLYRVQFLQYDDNYAMMGLAFLISCATTLWMGILYYWDFRFIKKCWWQTIGFLLVASPFTVIVVITNYKEVFGDPVQL